MTRVKVCGLTDAAEAVAVAAAGADAVGLVFAESPRRVSMETARGIVAALPPFVQSVGVFVDEDPARVAEVAAACGLDLLQFHGEEPPAYCARFAPRAVKARRVRSADDIEALRPYEAAVRAFLLDAWAPDAHGGTGRTFDWALAVRAVRELARPVILAGGLDPENVGRAVARVRPWAVDVSSGVERAPGRKDPARVAAFVRAVAAAPEPA
ncbi:phosphoribosylanthranilate isomerase [Dissulfurirhabdus thermomarina]|uniref:N-(5'-phosphoribosyl)anthranilate isomerase n=1 Tax=Dissulfurirhabdus thermomarina TaxID=1765737 RepID=A0A6N9TQ02_DISTH|nr:phosphoribosylanthranilate isomerase [Dissulfurirhabdus thermomarina]NDY42520.1 phosphoribosylanthranilate isomerase [Dissulfurirhabdus thermomarina]NMX24207.1 phosphoribosylanthranilate isomerase [Dissulfurirhabdus thermomarina]